jgi:hypothetical protein
MHGRRALIYVFGAARLAFDIYSAFRILGLLLGDVATKDDPQIFDLRDLHGYWFEYWAFPHLTPLWYLCHNTFRGGGGAFLTTLRQLVVHGADTGVLCH